MRKKHTLDKKPPGKRAPFVMRPPNDNLEAYGWSLRQLRLPTDDPEIAGRPAFNIPTTIQQITQYGVDLQFIEPKYLQYMLDQSPEVRRAAEKVRAAGYSPEALDKFKSLIVRVFEERVLVDIVHQFFKVAPLVAQFYAGKLAYEDTFGVEEEPEPEKKPKAAKAAQIEASTTKSRR